MISSRSKRYWRHVFEGENGDIVKNILTDGQWAPSKPGGNMYGVKELFLPFWNEGDIEGKPTERQSKLFNQWCHTKNKNYYDGEDSLELLFKIALPRLKKDCGREDPWVVYVGIDKWLEWHPKENPAESLFEDIWFTLRHFYEPRGWQWLVWQWRTA